MGRMNEVEPVDFSEVELGFDCIGFFARACPKTMNVNPL